MNVSPLGLSAAALAVRDAGAALPRQLGPAADRLPPRVGARRAAGRALGERRARSRPRLLRARRCCATRDGLTLLEHTLPDDGARYPDLSPIFPAANRMQRAAFDLVGVQCDADDQRPWLWQAAGRSISFPLRRDFDALAEVGARRGGLSVRARRRRRRARDRRRARCTPASSSPDISASRSSAKKCCASRSAWATRTRASRSASRRCRSPTAIASPAASRATAPSPTRGPMRRRSKRSPARDAPPRAAWLRALAARARAHRQSPGRPGLSRQRRRLRVRPRAVLAPEGGRAAAQSTARSAIAC